MPPVREPPSRTYTLSFEWDHWAPGQHDPDDGNSDVWVKLDDGREFVGSFFTLRNVATLMERWKASGECADGAYFSAVDAIIVHRLDEPTVRLVVDDLLRDGTLETTLALCEPDDDDLEGPSA